MAVSDRRQVHPVTVARKRIITRQAKLGQLIAGWGRPGPGEAPDLVYSWGAGGACKSDSRILMEAIEGNEVMPGKSLRQELIDRGYDISTLRFSIERKTDL